MSQIQIKEEEVADDEFDMTLNGRSFLDAPFKVEYHVKVESEEEPNLESAKLVSQYILPDNGYEDNEEEIQPRLNDKSQQNGYRSILGPSEYLGSSEHFLGEGIFVPSLDGDLINITTRKVDNLTDEELNFQHSISANCFPLDQYSASYPPTDSVKLPIKVFVSGTKATIKNHVDHKVDSSSDKNVHPAVPPRERPFQCEQCQFKFLKINHLRNHLRTHTGEKLFKCDDCPKTFAYKNSLIRHARNHAGVRPYKCDECDRSYTQEGLLNAHKKSHSGTATKNFACDNCTLTFTSRKSVIEHQAAVHNAVDLFKCDLCDEKFSKISAVDHHRRRHFLSLKAPVVTLD